jgi:hypothetical protein
VQKLNGYQALWFARSREGASDYERMVRQKCLSSSLARQSDPMTVLTNYEALAKASAALIETDIPTSDLPGLLTVARQVPSQQINAISLVPPLVEPARPDFDQIQAMVERMLAGEPAVAPDDAQNPGDGSVGNAGSSASAATQGSVSAEPAAGGDGASAGTQTTGDAPSGPGAGSAGATAQELGLICQPV